MDNTKQSSGEANRCIVPMAESMRRMGKSPDVSDVLRALGIDHIIDNGNGVTMIEYSHKNEDLEIEIKKRTLDYFQKPIYSSGVCFRAVFRVFKSVRFLAFSSKTKKGGISR